LLKHGATETKIPNRSDKHERPSLLQVRSEFNNKPAPWRDQNAIKLGGRAVQRREPTIAADDDVADLVDFPPQPMFGPATGKYAHGEEGHLCGPACEEYVPPRRYAAAYGEDPHLKDREFDKRGREKKRRGVKAADDGSHLCDQGRLIGGGGNLIIAQMSIYGNNH